VCLAKTLRVCRINGLEAHPCGCANQAPIVADRQGPNSDHKNTSTHGEQGARGLNLVHLIEGNRKFRGSGAQCAAKTTAVPEARLAAAEK
jgi:hypothetical protein